MLFKPLRFLSALGVCAYAALDFADDLQMNVTEPEHRRLALLPILKGLGVAISAASFIKESLPDSEVDFTARNGDPCWYTCHYDNCRATRTNPLSSEFRYYKSGGKSSGCCFGMWRKCDGCCLDLSKYKNQGRRLEDSAIENTVEESVELPSPVEAAAPPAPVEERRRQVKKLFSDVLARAIKATGITPRKAVQIATGFPTTVDHWNGKDPCWWTCHKDQCQGTWTNPLSTSQTYYTLSKTKSSGCCFGKWGKCNACCLSLTGLAIKYLGDLGRLGRRLEDSEIALQYPAEPQPERRRQVKKLFSEMLARAIKATGITPRKAVQIATGFPTTVDLWDGVNACWWTCHKDQCQGTWTNPLSTSQEYYTLSKTKSSGCCLGKWGKCNACCLSMRGLAEKYIPRLG